MGGPQTARAAQLSLTDPSVCRSFLVGTCPHSLFTNTKQDLGPCPKVHAESLKTEYEGLPEATKHKYGFDHDYMRELSKHISNCNREIDRHRKELEKTPDEIRQTNVLLKAIADLSASIDDGLLEVQILGEMGEVGRAYDEFFRARQAQQHRAERERELKNLSDNQGPSGHQKLQVCDVCGAYLSRLDNDRRLADHFFGKMHLGYAQMRKTYDTLAKETKGRPRPPPMAGDDGPRGGGGYGDRDGWGDRSRGPRRGPGGGGGGGYGGGGGRRDRGFRGGW